MGISSGNSCHCKVDKPENKGAPLLAPLRGKMKVLKKIKRKMGLGQYNSVLYLFIAHVS